jgi:hypothetical protein
LKSCLCNLENESGTPTPLSAPVSTSSGLLELLESLCLELFNSVPSSPLNLHGLSVIEPVISQRINTSKAVGHGEEIE